MKQGENKEKEDPPSEWFLNPHEMSIKCSPQDEL